MNALKIIGIIIICGLLLLATISLIDGVFLLANIGGDSYALGAFLGRLFAELVLLAVLIRLVKSLRAPAQ